MVKVIFSKEEKRRLKEAGYNPKERKSHYEYRLAGPYGSIDTDIAKKENKENE